MVHFFNCMHHGSLCQVTSLHDTILFEKHLCNSSQRNLNLQKTLNVCKLIIQKIKKNNFIISTNSLPLFLILTFILISKLFFFFPIHFALWHWCSGITMFIYKIIWNINKKKKCISYRLVINSVILNHLQQNKKTVCK